MPSEKADNKRTASLIIIKKRGLDSKLISAMNQNNKRI